MAEHAEGFAAIVVFPVLNEPDGFASRTARSVIGPLSAGEIGGLELDEISSNGVFRHDRQAKQVLSRIRVFQGDALSALQTFGIVRNGLPAMA